ncbi:hypothetical protein BDV25DRAFT_129741 [Aspergillus avenaceus]|uniref:Aminoglycoside phosphotransferase domain-containing protein n=1 Tax=Aspergillus avenaceus TaxID=36643 RepID=A0A5N6TVX7_ASPAV|nr:hypothetical protein BDV25DRAFT_129741 [Aspergillus avenaceus]
MGWFDAKWLGQTTHFENPASSWKIIEKLQEHESRFSQDEYVSSGLYSESCCVFVCQQNGSSAQAIMKVRMQIPSIEDEPNSWQISSQLAETEICGRSLQEIKALSALSSAECSSTPRYIASKHENQKPDGWVPGGFVDYVVMEKLEGRTLSEKYIRGLKLEEKIKLRGAFKTSYLECQNLGFVNLDNNVTNLIWNETKMKCYIIDWEAWSRKTYQWNDNEYRWWGLQD